MTFDAPVGGTVVSGIEYHLWVLQNGEFFPLNTFTFGDTTTVYAYVSAIRADEITLTQPATELSIAMHVTKVGDPSVSGSVTFKLRRPPIALIHGYNSNNGAWFDGGDLEKPNQFVSTLYGTTSPDFIVPVEYGVDHSADPKKQNQQNISESFEALAPKLDKQLSSQLEAASAPLRSSWAYTRYDVVSHSQGGVLARMLCTRNDPDGIDFRPFGSETNAFRGRFRRVVTLGCRTMQALLRVISWTWHGSAFLFRMY